MSNLEKLLDERYPETEISHIQRQAFMDGYNAANNMALHFGYHLQQNYVPDWQIGRWNRKPGKNGESISTMNLLQEYISKD